MKALVTFIIIFCVIVIVHEFGHFFFAKRSGILVREFSIGMGPKIFGHIGKDGTAYTVRILPLGGYVRMAGWGDDETEIKTGTPVSLSINEEGLVTRVNLTDKMVDMNAIPMNVTSFDFEEQLFIKGLVIDEEKTYQVHHDATIVEEDGTEVRIAPFDVQYQNASVWGKLITNFAGPMNNFILGILGFIVLAFMAGGVSDLSTNQVTIASGSALAEQGLQTGDQILAIDGKTVSTYTEISEAIATKTADAKEAPRYSMTIQNQAGQKKEISVTAKKENDSYLVGVSPALKTGFWDKIWGGFQTAGSMAFLIVNALKNLIASFDVHQLGGPVAIYSASKEAADQGLAAVVQLMAFLSINIGIFNLIPIPALDGGKIVINLIEAIRRKPLKREFEMYVTLAGAIFMIVLMLVVTWNDIWRVFFK